MSTCRFCHDPIRNREGVKYGTRHYAHHACYLDAGKSLRTLHAWQVANFPYRVLKNRGLLGEAERIVGDRDDENIYGLASVRQSIEEDRC